VLLHAAFHPRAVEDAAAIDGWWKRNRPAAPDLFERELEEVVGLLLDAPTLGSLADPEDHDFPNVRRALMRRTRYHIYYRVSDATLEVLAIWHASRGEGPTLG
jgi:plasmid stabilization system protein ParE